MSRPFYSRFTRICYALPLLGAVLLTFTQCDKKSDAETPVKPLAEGAAPIEKVSTAAASTPAPSLLDHTEKMGFIARLTNDTEFYVGSVELKKHLEALHKTVWWKDASALLNDKTPAPDTDNSSFEALRDIWGDNVFLAGGAGFSKSAAALVEFNHLYQELNAKALMAGTATQVTDAPPMPPGPLKFLEGFFNDPATLARVEGFIASFNLPPLLFGVKTTDPAGSLTKIFTPELIKELQDKKVILGDLKTPDGYQFKTATVEVSNFLSEEWRNDFLKNLPADFPEAAKTSINKIIDIVRAKNVQIAWGVVGDHIILATGENLDHLKFSSDPASSLLGKPELAALLPHAGKDLLSLIYSNAATLVAVNDDQPFVPMLRGVVSAMKDNATFNQAGVTLEKQVDELTTIEKKVFGREATDLVGASWWDKGFHAEFSGGYKSAFMLPGKPLNYAKLLDQKGLLFGITYHKNPEYSQLTRTWVETIIGVLYSGTKEMYKAGIGGPQGQQQLAFFEALAMPTIQKVYLAEKETSQKGLGNETAFVVDVNGKPPVLPGVEPSSLNGFVRINTVNEVANREIISTNWDTIYETVSSIYALVGATSGAPNSGANPFPITQIPGQNGFTSWTVGTDFLQGDLAPNATISDKHLILGISPAAAESIAAIISEPAATPPTVDGCLWKLDLGVITSFVESNASAIPNQSPEKAKELQQNLQWIKPFRAVQGRIYQQGGNWHTTIDWDIRDVVSFD